MKRVFGLVVSILVSGACVALAWLALRPPVAAFLAPGATEIQVANVSSWEQHISYRCPGSPYAWYWATAHSLEEQLWTRQTLLRPDLAGPGYNPIVPLRFERVSFGFLVEEVVLNPDQGDPNQAHIGVYRRIANPWQQFLRGL